MREQPDPPYRLVVAGPAARAMADRLPEAVATAVLEFITGDLLREPYRVGKPLRGELTGLWSARRGTYRVLYSIEEPPDVEHPATQDASTWAVPEPQGNACSAESARQPGVVTVRDVEHRRDAYRRH